MFVSLAPPADLHVGTITVPPSGIVGTPFTLSYIVENLGANDAAGWWSDRLYLSVTRNSASTTSRSGCDSTHSPIRPFRSASTPLSFSGALPAVVPGAISRSLANRRIQPVARSNETNNVRASLASFSLDLPQITLVAGHAEVDVEQFLFNGGTTSLSIASARRRGRPLGLIPPGYRYRVSST